MVKKLKNKVAVADQDGFVTISIQTARVAQQALNKLNGGDGRSKVVIGSAEMEIEKALGPHQPTESPNEVTQGVPVENAV